METKGLTGLVDNDVDYTDMGSLKINKQKVSKILSGTTTCHIACTGDQATDCTIVSVTTLPVTARPGTTRTTTQGGYSISTVECPSACTNNLWFVLQLVPPQVYLEDC